MFSIERMTRPEVAAQLAACPVMLLPIGSCEQHGPHLPLATDTLLAQALCNRISDETGALVLPPLHFGYAWVWRDIPGTVSLAPERFTAVLGDVISSVARYGAKLLVFVNGHEANNAHLKYAMRRYQDDTPVKLLSLFYPGLKDVYDKEMESPTWSGMFHACEFETSLMLAEHPQLVHMERAVREYPERPPLYGMDTTSIGDLSQSGVYGDPTLAMAEKGQRMMAAFAKNAVALIRSCAPAPDDTPAL